MSETKQPSANASDVQDGVVSFLPTVTADITKESTQIRMVNYPFKNTLIMKSWDVGVETDVKDTIGSSLLELLKKDLKGKGNVWINSVKVLMSSEKADGSVGIAIHGSDDEVSSIRDLYRLPNRHFVNFGSGTKGIDIEWNIHWPTSVGRQINPYDPHYPAPHIAMIAKNVKMKCVVWFSIDHTKNIIDGGSF